MHLRSWCPAVQNGSDFLTNKGACGGDSSGVAYNVEETDEGVGVCVLAVDGDMCSGFVHHVSDSLAAFANNKTDGFARDGDRNLATGCRGFCLDRSGGGGLGSGGCRGRRCFRRIIICGVGGS